MTIHIIFNTSPHHVMKGIVKKFDINDPRGTIARNHNGYLISYPAQTSQSDNRAAINSIILQAIGYQLSWKPMSVPAESVFFTYLAMKKCHLYLAQLDSIEGQAEIASFKDIRALLIASIMKSSMSASFNEEALHQLFSDSQLFDEYIHDACATHRFDLITSLIDTIVSKYPTKFSLIEQILEMACATGCKTVISSIFNSGINLKNIKDQLKIYCFETCCKNGWEDIATQIIQNHLFDIDLLVTSKNKEGWEPYKQTTFELACRHAFPTLALAILEQKFHADLQCDKLDCYEYVFKYDMPDSVKSAVVRRYCTSKEDNYLFKLCGETGRALSYLFLPISEIAPSPLPSPLPNTPSPELLALESEDDEGDAESPELWIK